MPFNRINSRSIQNVESQAEAQERVSAGEPQDLLNSIMDPNREQRLNDQFLRARRSIGVTFLQDQLAERIRQSQQDTYAVKPGDTLWDIADRKSTRLNSSHEWISYAVFCLKKKKKKK